MPSLERCQWVVPAGADGEPDPSMPAAPGLVTFEGLGARTRMTVVTSFVDTAQMDTMLAMGMAEGMALAIDQIDELLTVTAGVRTSAQSPGDLG